MDDDEFPATPGPNEQIGNTDQSPRRDDSGAGNGRCTSLDQLGRFAGRIVRHGRSNTHDAGCRLAGEGADIGIGSLTAAGSGVRNVGYLVGLMARQPGVSSADPKVEKIRECEQGTGSWTAKVSTRQP